MRLTNEKILSQVKLGKVMSAYWALDYFTNFDTNFENRDNREKKLKVKKTNGSAKKIKAAAKITNPQEKKKKIS
jgi:hypothetical protein